jgi:four helix bundle protein
MTNGRKAVASDNGEKQPGARVYNLKERTAVFGEDIIRFGQKVPMNPVTTPLITPLVKAGTSVGPNYEEADEAESKKDFRHKICICCKESRESKFWLRTSAVATPPERDASATLWQEAKEQYLIICRIVNTCDGKPSRPSRQEN